MSSPRSAAPGLGSLALSRRTLLQLLGTGVGLGAVAACAPSAGPAQSASSAAATITDDGVTTFDFTSWSMNEAASKAQLQDLLDSYASSAGVTINTPSFPYNDYLKQLILQVQGGQTIGTVQLDIAWLSSVASLGKLVDLGSLAKGVDYTDQSLPMGQHDGVQVGLPWTSGAIGLVANQELLDKAGVAGNPKTLDDFEQQLEALKGLGGGVVPYAAMTKVANLKDIVVWMWTFGSPVVENDKITVGDDASVEALTWYKKLYDKGLIAPEMDRFDARALFGQGKVGFYDDGPVARKFVTSNATDPNIGDKLSAHARPVVASGDTPRSMAWGQVLLVVEGDGTYAAAEFAKHLTGDKDTALAYFGSAGYPPTTKAAVESKEFAGDVFATEFLEKITKTAQKDPLWVYPQSAQIYETLAGQVQAILIGQASPKDALETARSQMQALIS